MDELIREKKQFVEKEAGRQKWIDLSMSNIDKVVETQKIHGWIRKMN